VIDMSTGTMYVEAKSQETAGSGCTTSSPCYVHRLHALDITTGNEKPQGPVAIVGSAGGVNFVPMLQLNRPGLLLANGNIYIAFGSHDDNGAFHGWIFAYDAATLAQKGVFITTPNGSDGGIWMEGAGLAADANGNLFVATGNGDFGTTLDGQGFPQNQNYGDSIVKLAPDLGLATGKPVLDYFTPFDQDKLDGSTHDQDLGSGGVLLLPDQPGNHPHLLVQGGKGEANKGSTIYVIDRDQMTRDPATGGNKHFCAGCTSDTNIVNELPNGALNTPVPVYWNKTVYVRGDADVLKAFSLDSLLHSTAPLQTPASDTYSGRIIVSANGDIGGIVYGH
jgi:hypothetical protein